MDQLKKKIIESEIFNIYSNIIDEKIIYTIKHSEDSLYSYGITMENTKFVLINIIKKKNYKYFHFKNKYDGLIVVIIDDEILVFVYFDEFLPYQFYIKLEKLFIL